ncbi:MAG: hypothetical protein IJY22_02095 [Clostridia bacterium]|nr:hypothetical protein [Clostridia bacterium]
MKNEQLTPHRAAYMIAWRDRYIEDLQNRLAGREEENRMLSTLLFCTLLERATEAADGQLRVLIPTATVAKLLGRWQCRSVSEGENYAVYFSERDRAEGTHAKENSGE